MPEGAVYVGRPTKWGNPYKVGESYADTIDGEEWYWNEISPEQALEFFREAIEGAYPSLKFSADDIRNELSGKDLVCWCRIDQPCHADILLRLANTGMNPTR